MSYKVIKFCVAILLSTCALNANAEVYWGAGFGNSSFDLKPGGVVDLEDSTTIRFFGGSRSGNAGFEVEWNFAEYDWAGFGGRVTHDVSNLVISGVGYVQLVEGFDLYGKIGINIWSVDVKVSGTVIAGDNGAGMAYGGGLDISAIDNLHFRIEYQIFPKLNDSVFEGDISQLMLNLTIFI